MFDEDYQPFVIIECKEPAVALTLTAKKQVENYNTYVQAPYIAITNGVDTEIYEQVNDGYQLLSLKNIADLLQGLSYTHKETAKIKRRSYKENTRRVAIDKLIEEGNISPISTYNNQRFYAELWNDLLTESFETTNQFPLLEHIEDLGYGYYGFQNGSGKGGRFNFDYRNFKVTIQGETVIYQMTIAAAGTMSNDAVYGNRKGSTDLCVGIQKKAHNAHVLELNLDAFKRIEQDNITVFHNGRGLQKYDIIQRMKEKFPQMMQSDEIILGKFVQGKSILTKPFSYLVEAVICYCYMRASLKEKVKS